MKKILTLACGLLLVAVSCNKNVINGTSEGMGVLSIDMSFSGETRAALSEDQILQTAKVNIYKADFSGLVRSYTYSAMPSPMYLAADSYRVDVIAGEAVAETPAVASWENRSYKGSKAFEITAGNVTSVEVLAGVSNAVSSVSFDPSIAENFSEGYTFTIGLDANDAATSSFTMLPSQAPRAISSSAALRSHPLAGTSAAPLQRTPALSARAVPFQVSRPESSTG